MSIQIRVAGLLASAIIASAASAQTVVEWKVSEGGNGHWYAIIPSPPDDADLLGRIRSRIRGMGADLVSISSGAENQFVFDLGNSGFPRCRLVLGGFASGNPQIWSWIDGTPWSYDAWQSGEPDSAPIAVHAEMLVGSWTPHGQWIDAGDCCWDTGCSAIAIEWSADCNGDGIVDYGQILRGELIDLNANGVPDICETSISSVIPPSVPSQGGSMITIRGNFPPNPTVKVGGVVATNVNRVSVTQITATVPALLPGMASVQVNDFTLPDAIYIRPECGSDLDQDGEVTAADIAIILLDFGPCYEPPSTIAAPAPTPLLLPDATSPAPTPPAPQSAHPAPQPRERSS